MAKKISSETSEPQSLLVLMVEDSEDDVLLELRELKKGGYNPVYERVETEKDMSKALREKQWDIILCDYKMPKFNAISALAVLKETNIDIPIIVVSGTIGEETAVECMRLGAHDYIMKGNLSRLLPAIERELKEAESRVQRKRAEEKLRESEERYRALFDHSLDLVYLTDFEGRFIDANAAALNRLGYTKEEFRSLNFASFLSQDQLLLAFKELQNVQETGIHKSMMEFRLRHKDGSDVYVETRGSTVMSNGKPVAIQAIARDMTERKQAAEEREKTLLCQQGVNVLQQSLIAPATLEEQLRVVTDSIVSLFDADFCRIWLIRPGDLCEQGCVHAEVNEGPHICRYRDGCLHLLASSGRYTHTDGKIHRRVPFGCYKIGRVASDEEHKFLTNDAQNDPRVHNSEWARELGLVSFAGYQIRVPGGKTLGVLALFAKHPISSQEDATLDGLSSAVALVIQRDVAEKSLRQTLESLRNAIQTTIQVLVSAVESRDPYTAGHQVRSAGLAQAIATEMGLPQERVDGIRMAGSIHDIGKLSIPAEILSKPTILTNLEFSLIKEHPRIGYEMLKDVESSWPLAQIVYQHHERINGSGYPQGLKGDDILLEARIMSIADVVEAMASHRPYRPALGLDLALEEISRNKGILYDVDAGDACLKLFREKGYKLV